MKITDFGVAIIESDTHIGMWVEQQKTLKIASNLLKHVRPFVRPGSVVVDAGANIGDHTIEFAEWAGVVHAFEPNPQVMECLRFNMRNQLNVTLHDCGLSDTQSACGFQSQDNVGAGYCVDDGNSVQLLTLDSFNLQNVSLIKADIEGFECRMLRGATETLKQKPALMLEVNGGALARAGDSWEILIQMVRDLRYTIKPLARIRSFADPQYDILCIPG